MSRKTASRSKARPAKKAVSAGAKSAGGNRTARLEARLSSYVYAVLKRAAEIEGRTLSDFVVTAAHEAARRAIADAELIYVTLEDHRRMTEALLNPPKPAPSLRKAFERHRELFGEL